MQTGVADVEFASEVRRGLRQIADPERAPQMQAYMKSAMPYLGVRVPEVRALVRTCARERPPRSTAALVGTVRLLWRDAEYREERYAATALTDVPAARTLVTPELISLYEQLIAEGAWWDHVDEVSHRVGDLLAMFRADVEPIVRRWQHDPELWLRRSSIICQIGARDQTDVVLLRDAIRANATDRDFFIRKGIGWALRDYARTDPDWVRAVLVDEPDLSPLSRREATKHL